MIVIDRLRTVYGTLLNFRAEHDAWAARMSETPYRAPPKAPVLYIKTANTFSGPDAQVALPHGVEAVEVGATIALLMRAPGEVAGLVLMNDWTVPHASYFRPPVKFKCVDGFLGVGDVMAGIDAAAPPPVEVRINGNLVQTVRFDALVRPAAQLLADVGEFMTLGAGDALMLGLDAQRPRAHVGDRVELRAAGLGTLAQTVIRRAT